MDEYDKYDRVRSSAVDNRFMGFWYLFSYFNRSAAMTLAAHVKASNEPRII
ncbi:hypothetical protein HY772_01260 [Candidatus Woesearchaeota archaeon]|nr:hypothetical protein [Candidatus Woesearchaeota archaeon]